MIMIVAPCCARFLCFLILRNISIIFLTAIIHDNKHKKLVISLVISPLVMKLDFFVAPATTKTFKIFCLVYSHGHITFMENPIIRIAAKFQYKIPSLRSLAVMDTISWFRDRPHRKSCIFLQRS